MKTVVAYYDLKTSPASYDIVAFLCAAERWRRKRGADKIAINILPGPNGGFRQDKFWPFNIAERQKMLDQVVAPMARMLPNASVALWRGSARPKPEADSIGYMCWLYGLKLQVECMKEGIRPLRPAVELPRDNALVTITLREAQHWSQRNSNVPAWVEAAKQISRKGYRVIVIRDTLLADQKIEGIETSASASWDLTTRAQLYRSASCNLFVNNGPAWFAMAVDAPVLMLRPVFEGQLRNVNGAVSNACTSRYFAECGIPAGGQIPNSPNHQRIVWEDDATDKILAAFEGFMSDSARVAA